MNYSPLRYPGGKSKISPLISLFIQNSKSNCKTYIEPFAGGSRVALSLLIEEKVDKIIINDYDKAIYSFWRAIKEDTNELINLIKKTPVSIREWEKQKIIYNNKNKYYSIELAFSAFFLNRTNRSGILNGGPIGGKNQDGNYPINARYNKPELINRIEQIAKRKKDIIIYNKEIRNFLKEVIPLYNRNSFIYFDPPYYNQQKRFLKEDPCLVIAK